MVKFTHLDYGKVVGPLSLGGKRAKMKEITFLHRRR